jgi:ribosomal protein S18 acetylase RimI-like enzyme
MGDGLADEIADLSFDALNEVRAMDGFPATEDREMHVAWLKDLDRIFGSQGYSLTCFSIHMDGEGAAGFIEGTINKSEPDFFLQRLVAVKKNLRGRGMGKHLKALMLDHLRTDHPEIIKIKTTNNAGNHPAIALNEKLGFEIIGAYKEYEIDTQKVSKSLG